MKVQISVRGRTYTVKSDEDDVDIEAVAQYVDDRMNEISTRGSAGMDEYTVAMLACMNIASDFERYRRQVGEEFRAIDRELAASEAVLRAAMPEAASASEGPG
ncbi:MAG: cell division protein ZapA [Myxococcota bacterium]